MTTRQITLKFFQKNSSGTAFDLLAIEKFNELFNQKVKGGLSHEISKKKRTVLSIIL